MNSEYLYIRYINSVGQPQNPYCLCQVSHEFNGASRGSAGVIITHESEQTGHWKI